MKFTLKQVRNFLPKLIKKSEETLVIIEKSEELLHRTILPENQMEELEENIQLLYGLWIKWVSLHGGIVRDYGQVDFDHGKGFYSWQFAEDDIYFEHNYDEDFSQRKPIRI